MKEGGEAAGGSRVRREEVRVEVEQLRKGLVQTVSRPRSYSRELMTSTCFNSNAPLPHHTLTPPSFPHPQEGAEEKFHRDLEECNSCEQQLKAQVRERLCN